MKIYLTAAWILRGYLSCLFYDYFLPSMLAARRARATVCLVITGARAELAGGERGGEDQRFPVRYSQVAPPPSLHHNISHHWYGHQSEKVLNFKSFPFISKENSMQMQSLHGF